MSEVGGALTQPFVSFYCAFFHETVIYCIFCSDLLRPVVNFGSNIPGVHIP